MKSQIGRVLSGITCLSHFYNSACERRFKWPFGSGFSLVWSNEIMSRQAKGEVQLDAHDKR